MSTVVPDALRPASLDDVVGQTEVVEALRIALAGARARAELPGHILLGGPAGTGKTTLALCIAADVQGRLISLIGPSIKSSGQLLNVLMLSYPRDVIFIDEIHRMVRPAQEFLFPVMEDGRLTFKNTGNTVDMPPLLFIGATTEPERLLTPMLDRFALVLKLRLYRDDELVIIASRAAGKFGCTLTDEAALVIAKAASGIPRVAIRLVRASRDYAYADRAAPTWRSIGQTGQPLVIPQAGSIIEAGADVQIEIVAGMVTIDADDVQRVLASTAYQWRTEGRKAAD